MPAAHLIKIYFLKKLEQKCVSHWDLVLKNALLRAAQGLFFSFCLFLNAPNGSL